MTARTLLTLFMLFTLLLELQHPSTSFVRLQGSEEKTSLSGVETSPQEQENSQLNFGEKSESHSAVVASHFSFRPLVCVFIAAIPFIFSPAETIAPQFLVSSFPKLFTPDLILIYQMSDA